MAYRGQGQKVQKVMVQPIVSFRWRVRSNAGWAREMEEGASEALSVVAVEA